MHITYKAVTDIIRNAEIIHFGGGVRTTDFGAINTWSMSICISNDRTLWDFTTNVEWPCSRVILSSVEGSYDELVDVTRYFF